VAKRERSSLTVAKRERSSLTVAKRERSSLTGAKRERSALTGAKRERSSLTGAKPSRAATPDGLRAFALGRPGTAEGIACKGTALESRTVTAGNKAFLFLAGDHGRLKLGASLAEARELAATGACEAGAGGWVKFTVAAVPRDVLERWIDESWRLLAPKMLVASLPKR
jgi:hypothetical protein